VCEWASFVCEWASFVCEWVCFVCEWASSTGKDVSAVRDYGVATISRFLKLQVSFAKEPYKIDYILQKSPVILRSPLIVATRSHPTVLSDV